MTRAPNFWTEERIELLKAYHQQGLSGSQIAKRFGNEVSRCAVIGKLHRLKLPKRSSDYARETDRLTKIARRRDQAPKAKTVQPEARPPRVIVPFEAFDPIPDTTPQPWEQRGDGCNWPVGDGLSCCEPVHASGWCRDHHALGRVPLTPKQRQLSRALRRWVA